MTRWRPLVLLIALAGASCAAPAAQPAASGDGWVYQLQGYPGGRLDRIAEAPGRYAVIDLTRDGSTGYFQPAEIAKVKASGKTVLAYFEIGSLERFRPDYTTLATQAPDLLLNPWTEWPDETFGRYWDERWWDQVVRPRLDKAIAAGFDGAYLDTPLAYEQIDLHLVPGQTRETLARAMVTLITRISQYAKAHSPGFRVVPQNSPELRQYPGYTEAIDGIGVEELFYLATDEPCAEDYCSENLADVKALRAQGKFVLAVDYATNPAHVRAACARYRQEHFAGFVGVRNLDRISTSC